MCHHQGSALAPSSVTRSAKPSLPQEEQGGNIPPLIGEKRVPFLEKEATPGPGALARRPCLTLQLTREQQGWETDTHTHTPLQGSTHMCTFGH